MNDTKSIMEMADEIFGPDDDKDELHMEYAEIVPMYIFDLDGTLANIEHRLYLLADKTDKDRWRNFYASCVADKPMPSAILTMGMISQFADVKIWTGRSDEVAKETVTWLAEHAGLVVDDPIAKGVLRMRPDGDCRPDWELKQEWLEELPSLDRARLIAVFEDRSRVVEMYRGHGVQVFQVSKGEY